MPNFKGDVSINIQAPAKTIYDYLLDFTRHPEWNHQPVKITKISDGPIGVGSTFHAEERPPEDTPWIFSKIILPVWLLVLGARPHTEAEIMALEPGKRIAWRASAPGRRGIVTKAKWEIMLEPQAEGTKLTQRFDLMPQHWLIKQSMKFGPDMLSVLKREIAQNLSRLKEILESKIVSINAG